MSFSGRVSGFAVPRGQSQTYYALMATGGIWKTVDGGTHFEPIFEHYGTQAMGWLAIAPSNPNILYLGTGEPMHARASTHGNGVWKSTDAGKTWTHVGLEKSYFIPMVAVDSKNPDIVYAAAEGKLYDNEMDCERGLFRSTDGGKTWTNVGPMKDRGVGDFVIDPRNSNVIIADAYKLYRRAWTYDDRDPENAIFKSTDGGKTWTRLTAGLPAKGTPLGRIGFAIFEKNPNIVYARVDEEVVVGFPERDGVANFRVAPAGGRGGGGGGFGGAAMGTPLFDEGVTPAQFKAFQIKPELAALAPKFTPVTGTDEADLVAKFNALVQDKDFVSKSGVDVAKLQAAAKKAYPDAKDLLTNIAEVEKLMAKPAPAADSSVVNARYQIVNRNVLEILYAGVIANAAPVKMNGVVYRSDDGGKAWKRMTEYKLSTPAAPTIPQEAEQELDPAAQAREDESQRGAGGARRGGRAGAGPGAGQDAGAGSWPAGCHPGGSGPAGRPRRRADRRQRPGQPDRGRLLRPDLGGPDRRQGPLLRRHQHDDLEGRRQDVHRRHLGPRQHRVAHPRRSPRRVVGSAQRQAHPERQRRRRVGDLGRRRALEPEEHDQRPAVLRRVGGQRTAVQHHGRHAGQRRVARAVAEPQQLRHVQLRLDLPPHRRRVRRRPRLVEPGVRLLREPVRRVEPDEPEHRRGQLAAAPPHAAATGRG